MAAATEQRQQLSAGDTCSDAAPVTRALRLSSEDLFQQQHEIEIEHHGRIYRLRRTQQNKLILTA